MHLEWKIGDVKITSINELRVSGDNEFVLPDASNAECKKIGWLEPHFMDSDGYLIFVVQAFVVDTGKRKIIVDTCIGNDKETGVEPWDNMQTSFLEDLLAAGYVEETAAEGTDLTESGDADPPAVDSPNGEDPTSNG